MESLSKRAIVSRLVAALKRCCNLRDLEGGKELHRSAVEAGLHLNKYVAATLITMYCKCGSMALAQQVFDGMSHAHRDAVVWNTLILGYVQNGESLAAMGLFTCMDCPASCNTYVAVLKALACESSGKQEFCLEKGIDIHKQIRERGFESDMFVASSLVDMYSKCGCMIRAREVFDRMVRKDVVTWNTLLLGYVQNGEDRIAMELFSCVDCEPDFLTYVAALKACGGLASSEEDEQQAEDQNRNQQGQQLQQDFCLEKGIAIHKQAAQRGFDSEMFVANSLIDMYSKCGSVHHSRNVFDRMVCKDVVSWTSLILGYVRNGESLAAMDVFAAMDCEPNSVTYVAALKACQDLGALAAGRQIHARVCRLGSEVSDRVVANTLIDLYGKCGCMNRAEEVFSNIHSPDIVSWNALITGYSCCPSPQDYPSSSLNSTCSSPSASTLRVFRLARKMQEAGVQMNGVTFICVLAACSHSGLVGEGKNVFDSMLRPGLKHYNCMADMLGRASRLQEAADLINKMPFGGNAVTWVTMLGACCRNKNMNRSENSQDEQESEEVIGKSVFDALLLATSGKGLRTIRRNAGGGYVLMRDLYRSLSLNRSVRYDLGFLVLGFCCGFVQGCKRIFDMEEQGQQAAASFRSIGVCEELANVCAALGWKSPTDIQSQAIPLALDGKDIIGLAQTGSGKTAAFIIPILQAMLQSSQAQPFFGCIISPTRELAIQIAGQVEALGSGIGVKCVTLVGGLDMIAQTVALGRRPHIVVGTPGRMADHLTNTRGFNLRGVKYLVLDEADLILDMNYEEALDTILKCLPQERKTYLFSATMTKKVAKLQKACLKNPAKVEASVRYSTPDTLKQELLIVPSIKKRLYLVYLLNELPGSRIMVFTRTCESSKMLALLLRNLGLPAIPINGQMSQDKRLGALAKFKSGERGILVCTDVASRGLDIVGVDVVISFDMPSNSKDYVHRAGRTARAGKTGRAIAMVTEFDAMDFLRVEKALGKKLPVLTLNEDEVNLLHERVLEAQRIANMHMKEQETGKKKRKGGASEDTDDILSIRKPRRRR